MDANEAACRVIAEPVAPLDDRFVRERQTFTALRLMDFQPQDQLQERLDYWRDLGPDAARQFLYAKEEAVPFPLDDIELMKFRLRYGS